MIKKPLILVLLYSILVTACTHFDQSKTIKKDLPVHNRQQASIPKFLPAKTGCDIIHYYQIISGLTENQRNQTAIELQTMLDQSLQKNACYQIKLAILLSAPYSPIQDDKASIDLLDDFIKNTSDQTPLPSDKIFATFLKQFVEERSLIRYQHSKTKNVLKLQQQESETVSEELAKTRQQLQQLKSLESELNHQEKRISNQPAS